MHEYHQVRLILDDMNIARIPLLVWHKQSTHARSGHTRLRQATVNVGRLLSEAKFADFSIFQHTLDHAIFPLSLSQMTKVFSCA